MWDRIHDEMSHHGVYKKKILSFLFRVHQLTAMRK